MDLLARMVDEPRDTRQRLFPLLPALFSGGVFAPKNLLREAVEAFVRDVPQLSLALRLVATAALPEELLFILILQVH